MYVLALCTSTKHHLAQQILVTVQVLAHEFCTASQARCLPFQAGQGREANFGEVSPATKKQSFVSQHIGKQHIAEHTHILDVSFLTRWDSIFQWLFCIEYQ